VGLPNAGLWVVARLGEAFSRVVTGWMPERLGPTWVQAISATNNNSMQLLWKSRCENESIESTQQLGEQST
jgi:hypothetical protein